MAVRTQIEIINKLGLHARAASKLVATASRYEARIEVTNPAGQKADAKSIMSILMLAAAKGMTLDIEASGEDEQEALDAICTLINNRFDEPE
ncbi:MAG: HPr family phosphocarrier protein [Ketobacteraceae bacterium]|nr:HPr family phosphocarrier protein [Ketobacteraceae bacterium]